MQDLRLINAAVIPAHPLVPNPYTLLSSIPPQTSHFTVIDLKDAFFTIPLHPDCQFLFAFTWTDPDTQLTTQLTWTVLPQGLGGTRQDGYYSIINQCFLSARLRP